MRLSNRILRSSVCLALVAIIPLGVTAPAAAETRGFVVTSFVTANNSVDYSNQCPEDRNKSSIKDWVLRDLISTGFTKDEALKVIAASNDTIQLGPEMMRRLEGRAIVNGKHSSIYNYPDAVPDPNIETVTGK